MSKKQEFCKPRLTFGQELKLTPYAWAKLLWMRDKGGTEVAGYCVTGTNNPLLITDFVLIKQECTIVTFDLDSDDSVEYVERMMDEGLAPWQCMNILAHTHPGDSTDPSSVDEENFEKAFSHPNWAIMLIVGQDGSTYCRLKMNTGPGTLSLLDVVIDYGVTFKGADPEAWGKEYEEKVSRKSFQMTGTEGKRTSLIPDDVFDSAFQMGLGATNQRIEERDRRYAGRNSSLWWDDKEAMYIELTPEQIQQKEFDEELDDMDCCWDMDGDAVCWADGLNDEAAYYYNPDTHQWQIDDGSDDGFKVCQPPTTGGLATKIVAWAKRNAHCRPEIGKEVV